MTEFAYSYLWYTVFWKTIEKGVIKGIRKWTPTLYFGGYLFSKPYSDYKCFDKYHIS